MKWIIKQLIKLLSKRQREMLAYELVRDEVISNVMAEKIIEEVIKDQNNKVISFIVKD